MPRTASRSLRAASCEADRPWLEEVARLAPKGPAQAGQGSQRHVLTSTFKPGKSGAADAEPAGKLSLSPTPISPETS